VLADKSISEEIEASAAAHNDDNDDTYRITSPVGQLPGWFSMYTSVSCSKYRRRV
jgi:hypothetical protein